MGNTTETSQAWLELPGGKLHPLARECRIGRAREGNDLVLDERLVSSRHVIINAESDGFILIDQHSTNGTYVNGMLVQKATVLKDGDDIRLANIVPLRFRCTRELKLDAPASFEKTTVQVNQLDARECWLLLVDVAGYSGHIARLGSAGALQRLQTWISEMRPLIEGNGGAINTYTGDGIFAYWPCDIRPAAQLLAALRALESYRTRATLAFRYVVHHGQILFTKSSLGEELSGQEVNFAFRSEKIAKRLVCPGMLSEAAAKSLNLEGRCDSAGTSVVDGIEGSFTFYRLPRDIAGAGAPAGKKRILLVEETPGASDEVARLIEADGTVELCERAQHGASARKLHAKHKPDLVVIDLAARTGETLALIGDLLAADPQTRVLVFTAVSERAYIERALQAGALGYLLKGEPNERVLETIRVVAEGGMFLSRQIRDGAMRHLTESIGKTPRANSNGLSEWERDVLRLIGLGRPNQDIASALGIGLKTVEVHRENLQDKLNLASPPELVVAAKRWADDSVGKSPP